MSVVPNQSRGSACCRPAQAAKRASNGLQTGSCLISCQLALYVVHISSRLLSWSEHAQKPSDMRSLAGEACPLAEILPPGSSGSRIRMRLPQTINPEISARESDLTNKSK